VSEKADNQKISYKKMGITMKEEKALLINDK